MAYQKILRAVYDTVKFPSNQIQDTEQLQTGTSSYQNVTRHLHMNKPSLYTQIIEGILADYERIASNNWMLLRKSRREFVFKINYGRAFQYQA